ncbi:hypothetical protein HMPREF9946_01922 [Acetobacteraceae bacterium AT-5844]|nr:hypothetical protein HMPREF9946_01922 [Acetobacteraceae bacterium AT-5844]
MRDERQTPAESDDCEGFGSPPAAAAAAASPQGALDWVHAIIRAGRFLSASARPSQ